MATMATETMHENGSDAREGIDDSRRRGSRAPRGWRRRRMRLLLFVVAVVLVVLARPVSHHARAASFLMTFSDATAKPDVVDERTTFESDGERVPARIYVPTGVAHPPGVVLVHGVHHRGIDEPRLERFARAVAASGVVVMTPAVKELSDYEVAPRSIGTTGAAVLALRDRLGVARVGLMGMSFGGGISLLAAADERFRDHVSFVVAVGAHDDLRRVSRFFVTDEIDEPSAPGVDGTSRTTATKLKAHGYGVMVLVYSHAEDFFPAAEVPVARKALHLWLEERRDDARATAEALSPSSKDKLDRLFGDGVASLRAELLSAVDRHQPEMAAVSPHGRLGGLRANVYLLHGAGDTVIPKAETLWLAEDVPRDRLREVLVSPAIEHVELRSPSAADEWALVHFMSQVLTEADAR